MRNYFEPLDDGSILVCLQERDGQQYTTAISCASLIRLRDEKCRFYAARMRSGVQVVANDGERLVYLARIVADTPDGHYAEHSNRDSTDNRRSNLRNVTVSQRLQNRMGAQRNSRTGVRGVHINSRGKFVATSQLHGRKHYIGTFDRLIDAQAAVQAWRAENMTNSEMDKHC